ncbi:MAG: CDP-glycerol glycerophosphotransferase [Flavobacteriaceae bacterium]|nr:CDP-glycerol glycerophosphotransferase [Flavobacteriaceae bacterium]
MVYKFLIYISYTYAIPIGKPLENEINKRGYVVKWFSDEPEAKKELLKSNSDVFSNIEEVIAYEPHIILAATDSVPDFINALKVQIFHGFNAEKRKFEIDHFRIRGLFDLYCTQGPSTTSVFKRLQEKQPHYDVIETGWSKVDPLFPITMKEKSKIPTIFVASTFTERLSLAHDNEVFEVVEKLSNSGKYKFLMVLHPKIPIEIVNKWKALENEYFTFYNTTNLIPLFKKADIMFADTTSAIQEFLIQKKPVVTFKHFLEKDYLIQIKEASKIEKSFDFALTYPEELINKIEKYILELHPYFDGKSSERIINATINFLHKDKDYLKPKPLNLVRKFKMRKHLKYYTLKSYNKPLTIKIEDLK